MKTTYFIVTMIALGLAFHFWWQTILVENLALECDMSLGECIELKTCIPEIIKVPETSDEYLEFVETQYYEDDPIWLPAEGSTTEEILSDIYDLPLIEPEPPSEPEECCRDYITFPGSDEQYCLPCE